MPRKPSQKTPSQPLERNTTNSSPNAQNGAAKATKRKVATQVLPERPRPQNVDLVKEKMVFDVPAVLPANQVSVTGKKNKRTPERIKQINERIEQIRGLMAISMTRGDITRSLAITWGVSVKCVDRYYDFARKRQKEFLDRNGEELKQDSLGFWTRKLREALDDKNKAQKMIDEGHVFAKQSREMLDRVGHDVEQLVIIDRITRRAQRMIEMGVQNKAQAEAVARGIQDRLDKLNGNYAPERIALVNTKGEDIQMPEPITHIDMRQNIINVINQHRKELSPEDMAVVQPLLEGDIVKVNIPIIEVEEE